MRGLLADTYREMLSRKFLYLISFMTLIGLAIIYLVSNVTATLDIPGNNFPKELDWGIEFRSLDQFLGISIFVVTIFTAGLIPLMFEKGRAEYYLSKPISRIKLLTTKIIAIWVVYGSVLALSSFLIVIALRFLYGTSILGLMYIIIIYLLLWIIWLSITSFSGLIFGSASAAIASSFAIWVLQKMLSSYEFYLNIIESEVVKNALTWAYYIVPKTSQISDMGILLAMDKKIDSLMPLWSSLLFAIVMIVIVNWVFKRRDY